MLRLVTWLLSLAFHGGLVLLLFLAPGGNALQQGAGHQLMVVQQGTALEGLQALGHDEATVRPVEAPTPIAARPVPQQKVETPTPVAAHPVSQPQDVKPVEDTHVIQSTEGPKQQIAIKPPVKQPEHAVQQTATLVQPTVEKMQSSGQHESGGSITARTAYIGALRTRLEKSKVNPGSAFTGTVIVKFTVNAKGELISHEVVKSSGSKILDRAALESIEKAAPFPPMPAALHEQQFTMSVPYTYRVVKR